MQAIARLKEIKLINEESLKTSFLKSPSLVWESKLMSLSADGSDDFSSINGLSCNASVFSFSNPFAPAGKRFSKSQSI